MNKYFNIFKNLNYEIAYLKSVWEAGTYTIIMTFPTDYPLRPPKC